MNEIESKQESAPTLTTILQFLVEIEEIMNDTKNSLEYVCNQEQPETESEDAPKLSTTSLSSLQQRVNSIRRLASRTRSLTGDLIG